MGPVISKRKEKGRRSALLVIDVQNDFISGALALRNCPAGEEGEEVVEVINDLRERNSFDLVAFSLDWHPAEHCSFHSNVSKYPVHESSPLKADTCKIMDVVTYDGEAVLEQVMWPDHCVQNSHGAKLHEKLKVDDIPPDHLIKKGQRCDVDSYSAFWDNGRLTQTKLLPLLQNNNITDVYVVGLAFDFCVAYTALDAASHGFRTSVVEDACRSVSNDTRISMREKMEKSGVRFVSAAELRL